MLTPVGLSLTPQVLSSRSWTLGWSWTVLLNAQLKVSLNPAHDDTGPRSTAPPSSWSADLPDLMQSNAKSWVAAHSTVQLPIFGSTGPHTESNIEALCNSRRVASPGPTQHAQFDTEPCRAAPYRLRNKITR